MARVLVCDDSGFVRAVITRLLEADTAIRVVAHASNGLLAVQAVRRQAIDVVVLDLDMPVMDGLTALPLLLQADPTLRVIVASSLSPWGAEMSMRALALGASGWLAKPGSVARPGAAGESAFGAELIEKVKGLARLRRTVGRHPASSQAPAGIRFRAAPRLAPLLLALGSSTGGPNALFSLIRDLGRPLRIPVVLTQHMPAEFISRLAEHIGRLGVMPCAEARDGAPLLAGHIMVAPGGRHMLIRRETGTLVTRLSDEAPQNFCRPSIDPMLRSAAEAMDGRVLVVMLTGMGHDGLEGTREVVARGGSAVVQDEASSVVWGMPGAVAHAGLAHAAVPLGQMAGKILSMLGASR